MVISTRFSYMLSQISLVLLLTIALMAAVELREQLIYRVLVRCLFLLVDLSLRNKVNYRLVIVVIRVQL